MQAQRRLPSSLEGCPKTAEAVAYAEHHHAGQMRAVDGAPFIEHLLEVARLLRDSGAPDHLVAAGVLHDTIEKSDATASDLMGRFGARITKLVLAVTENDGISDFAVRKAELVVQVLRAGDEAMLLFAADKVAKVRELRLRALSERGARDKSYALYLAHYRDCLQMLESRIPDSSLVAQLRAELGTSSGARFGVPAVSVSA